MTGPAPDEKTHDAARHGEETGEEQGRRVAEWITLVVSLVLLLGIAGYLVYRATLPSDPYVAIEVRPLLTEARQVGSDYILPIEARNRGRHTLRDVRLTLRLRPPGGPTEEREATIDTLGEYASERLYLYLSWPPDAGEVAVEPLSYRIE